MDKKYVNGYIETVYNNIPLTDKKAIVVCTSERESDGSILADIRQFRLYKHPGEPDDGIMRPTPKGVKFHINKIPAIVAGMLKIYMEHMDCGVSEAFDDILRVL